MVGNGRETLRLRSKGAATVQEVVSITPPAGTCSTIPLTHWESDTNTHMGVPNRHDSRDFPLNGLLGQLKNTHKNKQPRDESPHFQQQQRQQSNTPHPDEFTCTHNHFCSPYLSTHSATQEVTSANKLILASYTSAQAALC